MVVDLAEELTAEQWELLAPILSRRYARGRPRADDQAIVRGILYLLRTGGTWQDVRQRGVSASTCWRRLELWEADGTWERVWLKLVNTFGPEQQAAWSQALLRGNFVPSKRKRGSKRSGPG